MYEIPSHQNISKVIIDDSVVTGGKPLLMYTNDEQPKAAASDTQ